MKHIKKVSALLMCALIALSACLTASAADTIKPTEGPFTLNINLYEAVNQATKEDLETLATTKGDGEKTPGVSFKKSTFKDVKFYIYPANSTKTDKATGSTATPVKTNNGVATYKTDKAGTYWVELDKNTLPKEVAAVLDIQNGFAVDLPMTNPAGNGWLSTVNVYPKVDTVWGKANFVKEDSSTHDGLEGAKFTLYRTDITEGMLKAANFDAIKGILSGLNGTSWTQYKTNITSGENGKFDTGRIPYGAYKLVETQAPSGYSIPDNNAVYFIIDGKTASQNGQTVSFSDGITQTIGEVTILNTPAKGVTKTLLTIDDYDVDNPTALPISTSEGKNSANVGDTVVWKISVPIPADISKSYTEFYFEDTFNTTAFTLQEVKAKVPTKIKFKKGTDFTVSGESTIKVDFKSAVQSATINSGFAGCALEVYIYATVKPTVDLYNGVYNTAKVVYNNGGGSADYTSLAKSENLYTGGYTFKKVGSDTNGEGLPGAKFKVYKKSDNEQVTGFYTNAGLTNKVGNDGIVTSDDDGLVHIYGLAYGSYYLVEVQAPTGYELNGEKINFTIGSNSSATVTNVDSKITNEKSVTLPFTGGVGAEVVVASGVVMMVAAGFVLKKRVK